MSIEKRAGPMSRSFRSLIKTRRRAKSIKDLKDLSVLRVTACYRHSGPKGPEENKRRFFLARAMARDRPSRYGPAGSNRDAGGSNQDREVSPTGKASSYETP